MCSGWWQQWHNSNKMAIRKKKGNQNNNQLGPSCGPSAYIRQPQPANSKVVKGIKLAVCYGKSATAQLHG